MISCSNQRRDWTSTLRKEWRGREAEEYAEGKPCLVERKRKEDSFLSQNFLSAGKGFDFPATRNDDKEEEEKLWVDGRRFRETNTFLSDKGEFS
jgi:hypothetical protein